MGMSEDAKFGDGYDAIFGKKDAAKTPAEKKPDAKPADHESKVEKPDAGKK